MALTRQRRYLHPLPDETFDALARRALPEATPESALEQVKSWNLHIFLRRPSGTLLGADIVFIEAPL